MPSVAHEAPDWRSRAAQAQEVAGQLTDLGARKAVLELADSFDRLAHATTSPAVARIHELARQGQRDDA